MTRLEQPTPHEIKIYSNPCSDNILDDLDLDIVYDFIEEENNARVKAGKADFLQSHSNPRKQFASTTEAFVQNYSRRLTESPQITEWYNQMSSWMPEEQKKWWRKEFFRYRNLEHMSEQWWHSRTRDFIYAHEEGDIRKPLGALALTKVHGYERPMTPETLRGIELFYEWRGLIVEKSRQREGIGESLGIVALHQAIASDAGLASVAVSSNRAAIRMFEKVGGEREAIGYPLGGSGVHRALLCWESYEDSPVPCVLCPKFKNSDRWWNTSVDSISKLKVPEQRLERALATAGITNY